LDPRTGHAQRPLVVVTMVVLGSCGIVVVDDAGSACHEQDHIRCKPVLMEEMGNHKRKPEEMDNHGIVPLFGY